MKTIGALIAAAALLIISLPVVVFAGISGVTRAGARIPEPDIPAPALAAYQAAAQLCPGLSWAVLAGIGKVESDHGRSTLPGVQSGANSAGAEGPMQFLPATFAVYAVDAGDGDQASPYDLQDAVVAAAGMLCADGGADPARLAAAIWDYNHSTAYVQEVLAWAARYEAQGVNATGAQGVPATGAQGVPATEAQGDAAAAWALQQVGLPYQWGAVGPDAFDCSGLALRAWQAAGVALPRVAAAQYQAGAHVPLADARVGDLVFFAADPANPSTIDHVGIYLDNGMMVAAPHTGATVAVMAVYPQGRVPTVTRPWS